MPLNGVEDTMIGPLLEFFGSRNNFEIFSRYRNKKGHASVSLLDWFIVKYAKEHKVQYSIVKNGRKRRIIVEQSYASALHAYTKEYFDPFARGANKGKQIGIKGTSGEIIYTTLRQLNFFRWAIDNGIIDYVDKHIDEIYSSMIRKKKVKVLAKRRVTADQVKIEVEIR